MVSHYPRSGEVVTKDFRKGQGHVDTNGALKVVQWNIERGYKIDKILSILRELDADILCLQELDIGCARSGSIDCFETIGKSLELNGIFVTEFEEVFSSKRAPKLQVPIY
jgi:endonuclease/exonuclease/phosphatase family metal-dependent hydrolase